MAAARFMAKALQLARRGLYTTDPNPRVGCVLVKDNRIIAQGWHMWAGKEHAEVQAIRAAGGLAAGASLYVNLEPCCYSGRTPPCVETIVAAGIRSVHAAILDPHPKVSGKGMADLKRQGVEVSTGLMATEARRLNRGFIKRWEEAMPWVRCKLAMGLEGATGFKNGKRKWITAPPARRDGHKWRARSSAVITSAKTAANDNALLTARLDNVEINQPLRVLIDSSFSLAPTASFFAQDEEVLWIGSEDAIPPKQLPLKTHIHQLPTTDDGLCLKSLISHLAKLEMNEVMIEAGPCLTASFLRAQLVDELIFYIAPSFLGPNPLNWLELGSESQQFAWQDVRFIANDLRIIAHRLC